MNSHSIRTFVAGALLASALASRAPAQGELFVTNSGNGTAGSGSVLVFDETTSNGNVAPLRKIMGTSTGLIYPAGIKVNKATDEIVVADLGSLSILTFAKSASGNAAPLRAITGPSTQLSVGGYGVSIDNTNNELWVTLTFGNALTVYPRTASGDQAPTRGITGSSTGLNNPGSVWVDPVHNEVFVTNFSGNNVLVFSRTASGNVAPIRSFASPTPSGIAYDATHDEIWIGGNNAGVFYLSAFARTASGAAAPLRTISGNLTGLSGTTAMGVAVDEVANLVAAANSGNSTLTVYPRTANGNVQALRTIGGALSTLNTPIEPALAASAPPAATRFFPLPPCRVIDTRNANGALGGPALQPSEARLFTVIGTCGIPASAVSLSVNATIVPNASGSLVLYAGNNGTPATNNLSFRVGRVRANNALVRLATDGTGRIAAFNSSTGVNHFILDVNGYFR